jgi:hypothetical protein
MYFFFSPSSRMKKKRSFIVSCLGESAEALHETHEQRVKRLGVSHVRNPASSWLDCVEVDAFYEKVNDAMQLAKYLNAAYWDDVADRRSPDEFMNDVSAEQYFREIEEEEAAAEQLIRAFDAGEHDAPLPQKRRPPLQHFVAQLDLVVQVVLAGGVIRPVFVSAKVAAANPALCAAYALVKRRAAEHAYAVSCRDPDIELRRAVTLLLMHGSGQICPEERRRILHTMRYFTSYVPTPGEVMQWYASSERFAEPWVPVGDALFLVYGNLHKAPELERTAYAFFDVRAFCVDDVTYLARLSNDVLQHLNNFFELSVSLMNYNIESKHTHFLVSYRHPSSLVRCQYYVLKGVAPKCLTFGA